MFLTTDLICLKEQVLQIKADETNKNKRVHSHSFIFHYY
nr:MAG TPA: hypothetical protein [Caudoviricetes sp.]